MHSLNVFMKPKTNMNNKIAPIGKVLIINRYKILTLRNCYLVVPDFPLNFATYFYRGEFRELLLCYLVDRVDRSLHALTKVDS